MRLNLGCGYDVREGYVNLDRNPLPGVVVVNVELGLPFPDDSVDEVVAHHVLEHLIHLEFVMREIHRVLRPGGQLVAEVPYGFRINPFHVRYFNRWGIRCLAGGVESGNCCDAVRGGWKIVRLERIGAGFPAWHLLRYLKVRFPFGLHGSVLQFTFEKTVPSNVVVRTSAATTTHPEDKERARK